MISKFQFTTVDSLLSSGVDNYVLIRQQVGLTSEELDDILTNYEYYQSKFSVGTQNSAGSSPAMSTTNKI